MSRVDNGEIVCALVSASAASTRCCLAVVGAIALEWALALPWICKHRPLNSQAQHSIESTRTGRDYMAVTGKLAPKRSMSESAVVTFVGEEAAIRNCCSVRVCVERGEGCTQYLLHVAYSTQCATTAWGNVAHSRA
jgi:hypothetical protein